MSRGQWIFAIAAALFLASWWIHVRRQEMVAAGHAAQVGNANAMIGIAGKIIAYIL